MVVTKRSLGVDWSTIVHAVLPWKMMIEESNVNSLGTPEDTLQSSEAVFVLSFISGCWITLSFKFKDQNQGRPA